MTDKKISKNEENWQEIFKDYSILENIKKYGLFEITSKDIIKYREPRLMTKFDQFVNLPSIFKENNLSILPITRGTYLIGNFHAYEKLPNNKDIKIKKINLPNEIKSIQTDNIYSESIALNCAFITGMINEIAQEELLPTISGRMSTLNFKYYIESINKNIKFSVLVKNSQCEIDGGFEGKKKFVLIEAKNYSPDDFIIRQLYYPFRLWKSKLDKYIMPIFMTFSNDLFTFYKYEFKNLLHYNSICLVDAFCFKLSTEDIQIKDITELLKNLIIVPEPKVPFPQADSFERVVDLLSLLMEKNLSVEEITDNYSFTSRQTDYYSNAGRYLGFITKKHENNNVFYCLTKKGIETMSKPFKQKYLSIINSILEHEVFYKAFKIRLNKKSILETKEIVRIMKECSIYKVESNETFERRAQTIKSWIEWILNLVL